jgi:hypothetical protein
MGDWASSHIIFIPGKHKGIGAFIVHRDQKGVKPSPRLRRSSRLCRSSCATA